MGKDTKAAVWIEGGYWTPGGHLFADQVIENDYPTESPLLGPDGKPLRYDRQPMGFDLRPRKTKP